jgi:hypothetical protein
MKRLGVLVLLVCLQAAAPPSFAQCALCRAAVESSEEGRAMSGKLNRAILLLLTAPLGVAGSVAAAMLRNRRRRGTTLSGAGSESR